MTPKVNVRLTISVNSIPRALLSIVERRNNDVMIIFRPSGYFLEHPNLLLPKGGKPDAEFSIKEQRFSIHQSLSSKEEINTLKLTISLENGDTHNIINCTKAIKSKTRFAYLTTRSCPDMTHIRYEIAEPKNQLYSIGRLNKPNSTLIYSIFVSDADCNWLGGSTSFQSHRITTTKFRFTIFCSEYAISPSNIAAQCYQKTIKPDMACSEAEKAMMLASMNGLTSAGCITRHKKATKLLTSMQRSGLYAGKYNGWSHEGIY